MKKISKWIVPMMLALALMGCSGEYTSLSTPEASGESYHALQEKIKQVKSQNPGVRKEFFEIANIYNSVVLKGTEQGYIDVKSNVEDMSQIDKEDLTQISDELTVKDVKWFYEQMELAGFRGFADTIETKEVYRCEGLVFEKYSEDQGVVAIQVWVDTKVIRPREQFDSIVGDLKDSSLEVFCCRQGGYIEQYRLESQRAEQTDHDLGMIVNIQENKVKNLTLYWMKRDYSEAEDENLDFTEKEKKVLKKILVNMTGEENAVDQFLNSTKVKSLANGKIGQTAWTMKRGEDLDYDYSREKEKAIYYYKIKFD